MFYRLKKRNIVNLAGVYTEEQVNEMDKRIEKLWKCLNNANSYISAYGNLIRSTNDQSGYRDPVIGSACDKLAEIEGICEKTLLTDD